MTEYLNASTRNGGVKQVVVPERTNISEVEEAPFDDQQYARVNGEWQPLFFQGSATMPTLSVEGESDLVPVLAYSLTSNVAKLYTSRPHGLSSGDDVFVSGIDATFNGAYTVVDVTSSTLTYAKVAADVGHTLAAEGAAVNPGTALLENPELRGLVIYGTEFLDYLKELPRGIQAWENFPVDANSEATETGYGEIGFLAEPGRLYKVLLRGQIENNSAQSITMRLRMTYADAPADAPDPKVSSPGLLVTPVTLSAAETTANADYGFSDFTYFYNETDTPRNVRILLTMAGGGGTILTMRAAGTGTSNFTSPEGGCIIAVEDVGPYRAQGGGYNLGDPVGLPPAPPSTPPIRQYTKTWSSTTAKCYMGSGAADSSQGAEDMKQGYSSYDGDSRSLWIFPTFSGAVGAASIVKVRLYLYANHWNNGSGGTALIKRHNYSSAPGSSPSLTTVMSSSSWPRDSGRWVTLPSSVHAGIIAGTIKGFGVGPAGTTNQLYYGRFNKAGAKVEITYKR